MQPLGLTCEAVGFPKFTMSMLSQSSLDKNIFLRQETRCKALVRGLYSNSTLMSKTAEHPFKDLLTEETGAASDCDISVFFYNSLRVILPVGCIIKPPFLLPPTLPTGPWGCVKQVPPPFVVTLFDLGL